MCKCALLLCAAAALAQPPKYGVGRTPTPGEIRQWDISVRPDGKNLPSGRGSVAEGKEIYAKRCSKCHGDSGQGGDSVPLVGGRGTLNTSKPLKTVESYWPYATTLFDYINRAMPLTKQGILKPNEVYALTAFILFKNGIIKEDEVMDEHSLPKVQMPNRDHFALAPEWKHGAPRLEGYP